MRRPRRSWPRSDGPARSWCTRGRSYEAVDHGLRRHDDLVRGVMRSSPASWPPRSMNPQRKEELGRSPRSARGSPRILRAPFARRSRPQWWGQIFNRIDRRERLLARDGWISICSVLPKGFGRRPDHPESATELFQCLLVSDVPGRGTEAQPRGGRRDRRLRSIRAMSSLAVRRSTAGTRPTSSRSLSLNRCADCRSPAPDPCVRIHANTPHAFMHLSRNPSRTARDIRSC